LNPSLIIPILPAALAAWALLRAARAIRREVQRQRLEEETQILRQCPELLEIVATGNRR
jgi:hypothetical protein